MKVKNKSSKKFIIVLLLSLLGVICLSFLLLGENKIVESKDIVTSDDTQKNDINNPTTIPPTTDYYTLFSNTDQALYEDSNLSIYLTQESSNVPKLIYAYKIKPEDRELTDNFFLHIYLKDSTKLIRSTPFANADFIQKPKTFSIQGQNFYVFQKDLISSNYSESYIPIENISYINTGRFKPKVGRSLDIRKLDPQIIPQKQLSNGLDKISITISRKAFKKIKNKRNRALKNKILITEDNDLVDGQLRLNNEEFQNVELRLKGDWTDHLKHDNKWSYRLIMKGESTFKGMRKFSIQHPVVRNYLWEWLFNKTIKDQGIIGLRYDFVDVNLTIIDSLNTKIPMGIMALEESFDKILIENNRKREGILLAFDESLLWKDREKQHIFKLPNQTQSRELHAFKNAPIKVFNENKVLSDPSLLKQFNTAKDLLEGLRQGKYIISEVFDIELLTTFVALSNLFGGYHGLIWHNLRIYYNPITNKLEPVSFDSNSGIKINNLLEYPLAENDSLFKEKLLEKLKLVSSTSFISELQQNHALDFESIRNSLYTEYNETFDPGILSHNSNVIKKLINPAVHITADLLSYTENLMKVEINNISGHPVTIGPLLGKKGRVLGLSKIPTTIKKRTRQIVDFELSEYFVNAFVSKKNKKGTFQYPKDVQKLRITHLIKGIDIERFANIKPYGKNHKLNESIALYRQSNTANFQNFTFIEKTSDHELLFKEGSYELNKRLVIPEGYVIKVLPGFNLDFKNNASLISKSSLRCLGTEQKPIRFFSSDGSGGGLFITNASQKSIVKHCIFDNLSNPQSEIWSVSGAINFHESDVDITHTLFKNNRCEDGLNIIRSAFTMTDTRFESTQSDAFDGDFVTGTLERCTFIDSGNDGIDVSGSALTINDITITNPSDKAISAGENSTISGANIKVSGGEIGVVSKDLSKVNLTDLSIIDTRLGLSAFQKKSEYGVASITISNLELVNAEEDYLIEHNSQLRIDGQLKNTVTNNVIDQMYGKEYGKSSR